MSTDWVFSKVPRLANSRTNLTYLLLTMKQLLLVQSCFIIIMCLASEGGVHDFSQILVIGVLGPFYLVLGPFH